VVGLEAYYITQRERSQDAAEQRLARVRQLPAISLDQVSDTVLITAGGFKARQRLSPADALIAAFAADLGAILVHRDPEYAALSTVEDQERLPFK
jgi:predicted nucleic acid-binding protein